MGASDSLPVAPHHSCQNATSASMNADVTLPRLLQILEALKQSHRTGIVHRDVKPQNVIISETDNKVKLIDMGAAADLRVGINYVPNEYLLDPRYAPPQQYIMSTQVRFHLFSRLAALGQ